MDLAKHGGAHDDAHSTGPDDTARARADAALQLAVGRGQLGLAEYEQRSEQVWAVRTAAELTRLTEDLAAPVPEASRTPTRSRDHTVAVLSEATTRGSADGAVAATAVLGSAVLDLRRTDLPDHVDVRAIAVLGETTVLVPRGVTVRTRGPALLGTRSVDVAPAESGAPVITVHGASVLGSVTVHHGDEPTGSKVAEPGGHHRSPWRLVAVAVAVVAAGYGVTQVATAEHRSVFSSGTVPVPTGQDTVDVAVLFGSEKVVVADDANVVITGGTIFGSTSCRGTCSGSGATVTVHGSGAFGSVEVVRTSNQGDVDDDG